MQSDINLTSFQSTLHDPNNGNIFLLGQQTRAEQISYLLIKFNQSNGEEVWSISWLQNAKISRAMDLTEDGDIIIVGTTQRSLYSFYIGGTSDIYIEKYDGGDGSLKWGRQYGTSTSDVASDVKCDGIDIFLTGYTKGLMFGSQRYAGDSYFISLLSSLNGDLLDGIQQGLPSTRDTVFWSQAVSMHIHHVTSHPVALSNITTTTFTPPLRYVVVLGDTNGLDFPANDGGDLFGRYFLINDTSTSSLPFNPTAARESLVQLIWSQQYDCKTSNDHLLLSSLDSNSSFPSPSLYLLCHLYLLKINISTGALTSFQRVQTQREKVYSIATQDSLFFLLSDHIPDSISITLPTLFLETRLSIDLRDISFTVPYSPATTLNSSRFVFGEPVESVSITALSLLPLTSQWTTLVSGDYATGDYLLAMQLLITTPSLSLTTVSLESFSLQYQSDCCHPSFGYTISSPVVIFLIVFHVVFPLSFLLLYHTSIHPNSNGSFFSSFCFLWLPISSQMINLFYLLSARFSSSHLLWAALLDLFLLPIIPIFFYEYLLHHSANFSSSYANTFLSSNFSSLLKPSWSWPPSPTFLFNRTLFALYSSLDYLLLFSMNARSLLIQKLSPLTQQLIAPSPELSAFSSCEDCFVTLIHGSLQLLVTCFLLLQLLFLIFLSLLYAAFDFLLKYFFYYFFLLSYFYSSYSEYDANNHFTFLIGRNSNYLAHTLFISLIQLLTQLLNSFYLRTFTHFTLFCLVYNGLHLLDCFYRYGIKYWIYLWCIKPLTTEEWGVQGIRQERRKEGYYKKNQIGVIYIANGENDFDADLEAEEGDNH
jgi:hypothetical protein